MPGRRVMRCPLDGDVVFAPALLVLDLEVASDTGFEVDR